MTLRWFLVFSTAFAAAAAARVVGGLTLQSLAGEWLHLLIANLGAAFAFVVAGATVAPHRQTATAVVLTILGTGLSLTKHVVGQYLAGNRVGTTNYLHAGLEIAGLLAGGAVFVVLERKRRPAAGSQSAVRLPTDQQLPA